jgi:high-affinity K+ transport system ATPase subunit B
MKEEIRHENNVKENNYYGMSEQSDNPLTATAIAAKVFLNDFNLEIKPEDKLKLICNYQKGRKHVAMTGDDSCNLHAFL